MVVLNNSKLLPWSNVNFYTDEISLLALEAYNVMVSTLLDSLTVLNFLSGLYLNVKETINDRSLSSTPRERHIYLSQILIPVRIVKDLGNEKSRRVPKLGNCLTSFTETNPITSPKV